MKDLSKENPNKLLLVDASKMSKKEMHELKKEFEKHFKGGANPIKIIPKSNI